MSDDDRSTGADSAERWWRLAMEAWSERRVAVADAAVTRYRAMVPESHTARLLHAEILVDLRRFEDARQLLEALDLPRQPSAELPVVLAWARLHEVRGELEPAVQWFLRATELEPRRAASWLRLGEALARLGRLTEAEAVHRHATALDDEPGVAFVHLARVLRDQGRLDDALEATAEALALAPAEPEAAALRADLEQALRLRG